jgi:hypothetical protein
MNEQIIRITSIIGSNYCIASDDGEKVHKAILEAFEKGYKVKLSFEGIEDLTSSFLNAAVGQLYGEYEESQIKSLFLPPVDISSDDLELLKRVVERAKEFFRNPDLFRQAAKEVLGDDI